MIHHFGLFVWLPISLQQSAPQFHWSSKGCSDQYVRSKIAVYIEMLLMSPAEHLTWMFTDETHELYAENAAIDKCLEQAVPYATTETTAELTSRKCD